MVRSVSYELSRHLSRRKESALIGLFRYVFFTGVRGRAIPVKLADRSGMNFGNRHIDGYGFLACLDLSRIRTVAELAFDLDVSACRKSRGELSELPQTTIRCHSVRLSYVPRSRTSHSGQGIVLPARLGGEREREVN